MSSSDTQEYVAGAAIDLPLDRLHPIDLTFDRARAPRLCDGGANGIEITGDALCEACQFALEGGWMYIQPKPYRPVDHLLVGALAVLGDPHARAIPTRKVIDTRANAPGACISTGACAFGCPVGSVYRFPARLLPRLAGRPNYHLRPKAKVARLIAGAAGQQVDALEYLDTAAGTLHRLAAGRVALAAGAVDSPHILFNSATERDPGGLGNRADPLGRRLQDDPKSVLSTSLWRLWGRPRDFDIGYGDPGSRSGSRG